MNTTNPVHVFATWKVKEGALKTVLGLLKTVHDESVKEKGNLFYKIHQSNTDANTIILFEGYTDETAVTDHRNTIHFQEFVVGKIVPLLDSRDIVITTPVEY